MISQAPKKTETHLEQRRLFLTVLCNPHYRERHRRPRSLGPVADQHEPRRHGCHFRDLRSTIIEFILGGGFQLKYY